MLGATFIAHSAIKTLLGGVFGTDLLATVAIVASIILGEDLAAVVVVLMLGGGEILEEYISERARALVHMAKGAPTLRRVLKKRWRGRGVAYSLILPISVSACSLEGNWAR